MQRPFAAICFILIFGLTTYFLGACEASNDLECLACELCMDFVRSDTQEIMPWVIDIAVPICIAEDGTGKCDPHSEKGAWACKDLCEGMMREEADQVVRLASDFSSKNVCTNFVQAGCGVPAPNVPTASGATQIRSNVTDRSGEKNWASWTKPTGTFVHITDLHLQLDYAVNASTDCGQPICCRSEVGEGSEGHRAHRLGDWACDLSPDMWETMVDAIDRLPVRPDFILNTGDDPAHDVWNQDHESNLAAVSRVAESMLKRQTGRNIPFVNTFGNHEHAPVNQYKGPGGDAWLYEGSAEAWSYWLPEDAKRTLKYGGYYTMRVMPGLRALVCHSTMFSDGIGGNWAFKTNRTDIGAQFPWIVDVLEQARSHNEKVLMLRHFPMTDYGLGYDELMANITAEYADVIVASFAGHAHDSWLSVLQNAEGENVDVTYVSGSGTPGGGNPTFRVFHYDLDTFELTDYDSYWVDLDQAIETGEAIWKKDHSARSYYGMKGIDASDWVELANSWLKGNDSTASWLKYARAITRDHEPASSQKRINRACEVLTSLRADYDACKRRYSDDDLAQMDLDASSSPTKCRTTSMGYRSCGPKAQSEGTPEIFEVFLKGGSFLLADL